MENFNIEFLVNNLRARRDTLALASTALTAEADRYNLSIIVMSLGTGFFESIKYRLGYDNNGTAMIPIFVASLIAGVSSYIRFKKFPEKVAVLVQAETMLTNTLTNCRNQKTVDSALLKEYNASLQQLEISLSPEIRAKFLKMAQLNLISIMNQETKYFDLIKNIKEDKDDKIVKPIVEKKEELPQVVVNALSEISPDTLYKNYIVKDEPSVESSVEMA